MHQELPSGSANLSRIFLLRVPSSLISHFGPNRKNFNSHVVPKLINIFPRRTAFGAAHAPGGMAATRAADELMNALPIQLANAPAAPVLASPLAGSASTGDGSFASTLGRALAGMSDSGPGGASLGPKAIPRAKSADDDSSNSVALGGGLLNCIVTNLVQPAPAVTLGTGSVESSVANTSATLESSVDLAPSFASSLASGVETSAGAPSSGTVTLPQLPAISGGALVGNLATAASQIAGRLQPLESGQGSPVATAAKDGRAKSAGNALAAANPGDEIAPAKKNASGIDLSAAPISAAAWVPAGLSGIAVGSSPHELTAESASAAGGFSGSRAALVTAPSESPIAGNDSSKSNSLPAPTVVSEPDSGAWAGRSVAPSPVASAPATFGDNPSTASWDASDLMPSSSSLVPSRGQNLQAPTSDQDLDGSAAAPPSGPLAKDDASVVSQTSGSGVAALPSDQAGFAEFSAALGKFSDVKTSIGKSEGGAPCGTVHSAATSGAGSPIQNVSPRTTPDKLPGDFVQTAAASGVKNPANVAAKPVVHSPTPSPAANDGGGQKVVGQDVSATQAAVAAPSTFGEVSGIAPMSGLSTMNSPQKTGGASESNENQPDVKATASSAESSASASASDASAAGEDKSGQQSGTGPENNPPTPAVHSIAGSPVPDPAGNLLTTHMPAIPVGHDIPSTPPMPPASTQPASTLSAWQNYDGGAGKIVRSASLTESAGGVEMNVELRSGPLGPLEIHTTVREGSVGAEIHVQGQEAHSILSAGLPSLERALTDRNLRVENIAVYQNQSGGGMSDGQHQGTQSGSHAARQQAMPWNAPLQPSHNATDVGAIENSTDTASGLSVRA
jgi:hypothetical protein